METNELRYRGSEVDGTGSPPKGNVVEQKQNTVHSKVNSETTSSSDGAAEMFGRTPDGSSRFFSGSCNHHSSLLTSRQPLSLVFKVPTTHSFVHTLSHTIFTSHLTILTLATLALQGVLFWWLPRWIAGPFFFLYFAFWRAAYDGGLGWVLRKQSEKKWIVRKLRSYGWLAKGEDRSDWAGWWKKELEAKLGNEGYRWNGVPEEFNAWLMFRQLVDIILLK